MIINQISYRDIDIDIIQESSKDSLKLSWSFVYNNNRYANALSISSKKRDDIIGAVAALVSNACKTYEDLLKAGLVSPFIEQPNENTGSDK